jgi:virulence factor Mce-like protein
MIKQAPSLGRILTMVAFALSCFGILVFLWLSFGGSVPLQPKGYRINVAFPEATQLAQEADVRISGVKVGKVKSKEPNKQTGLTDTVLEIDARYAPIPKNTRAILRQKSLLGETYVELTPGGPTGPNGKTVGGSLKEGGTLPEGQVGKTVELDEILRTFDPVTRRKFSIWLDQQGRAVANSGPELNAALAALTPFAEETDDVLKILRQQSGATRRLVRDTGVVFEALSERQGQLRQLVVNSNRVWETTARRNVELAETFRVLPTFLREGRVTTRRLTQFAENTNPLINQLRPAARELSPTLIDLQALAPSLKSLFVNLGPLVKVSRTGLPATEQVLDNTRPVLARLDPFLRQVTPIFDYLGLYKGEIAAFFANDSAATQGLERAFGSTNVLRYLRTSNPTNPEIMSGYPTRLSTNRSNPYTAPGAYKRLKNGGHLQVFSQNDCSSTPVPNPPAANQYMTQEVVDLLTLYTFGQPENAGRAPPCEAQPPLGGIIGQPGAYPHVLPLP